jgi:hypothetical protein
MTNFKAHGNWVAVQTVLKKEHTTENGIVYNDALPENLHVWSKVYSVGSEVTEDIKVNDMVYWKLGVNSGSFYKDDSLTLDLVEFTNILMVDR